METIRYDFGEFIVYKDFVMGVIEEGVVFDKKHHELVLKMCREQFKDRSFGYISNRIFSYTLDPMVYWKMSKLKNLIAIAIVSDDKVSACRSYKIERFLFRGNLRYFDNLNAAQKWIFALLRAQKEKNKDSMGNPAQFNFGQPL